MELETAKLGVSMGVKKGIDFPGSGRRAQGEPSTPRRAADNHDLPTVRWSPPPAALDGAADLLAAPPRKRRRTPPPCACPLAPTAGTSAPRAASNGATGPSGRAGASNGNGSGRAAPPRQPNGDANGAPDEDNEAGGGSGSDGDDGEDDGGGNENPQTMETQCTWCDNGGFLLECDGVCRRTFHIGIEPEDDESEREEAEDDGGGGATPARPSTPSGRRHLRFRVQDEYCNVLDIPTDLAKLLLTGSEEFKCPGCLGNEHQCFYCHTQSPVGKGPDDVTRCNVMGCGRFYHPICLKKAWKELGKGPKVRSLGVCPLHVCHGCQKMTSKEGAADELVGCRRCPTAYHISCMPEALQDTRPGKKRLWIAARGPYGEVLPGCEVETSLIYCKRHKLVDGVAEQGGLFTPDLLDAFKAHCARKYPHLESSKELLATLSPEEGAEEEEEGGAAAAAVSGAGLLSLAAVRRLDRARAARHVEFLMQDARSRVGKDEIKAETRQPVPYVTRAKKAIEEGRLKDIEHSVGTALVELNGDPSRSAEDTLRLLLPRASVEEVGRRHDDLMVMMAPYMHGDRYTSYGRHFSLPELLKSAVEVMAPLLRPGDQIVDFSCGKNEWVPMVKAAAVTDGIAVTGRAYDIIVARDLTDFILKSWFDVRPGSDELERPNRLVIGLNPPFGKNNVLAAEFVYHAAKFNPRLIVLIVPPATPVPPKYVTVYEDRDACRGEKFYVPGSSKKSWNKETPALRVLAREDVAKEVLAAGGTALMGAWEEVPVPRRTR